ncbi:DNA-directed RNA polymerase subunit beta' [Frankliniella fusca]|uniref:DNA-directed RNA polymerase subunit beta n=1 Tax=Frankliniella fusca TaxID=407009 RepID=A0AAE1HLK8_9NEOP|nr:DNA-directed RNA polymerase subunit beta' [Frankliniella fusca]
MIKQVVGNIKVIYGVTYSNIRLPNFYEATRGSRHRLPAKASVLKLRVTNDCAERGVALVEEYNKILTADEEQKQFLILGVKEHRKRYPNVNKTTLGTMKENL